jgi:hypothetical protein
MSGFGIQPAGLSPAGVGTPATAPANSGFALRNAFDGSAAGSRKLDPATNQYAIDSYGRVTGMSSAQQLVQLAIKTDKGSSAVRKLGNELYKIDRITDNFNRRVNDVITNALTDLVNRKLIAITSIEAQQVQGSRAFIIIKWTDLSTNTEEQITI